MLVVIMQLTYNNKDYDIVVNKKFSQKNTYIRVKKDLKVTVTTNYFVTNHAIDKLIRENYERICKMIDFQEKKAKNNNGFFYLGKQYVVIYSDNKGIKFDGDKVYIGNDFDIDNWYKKEAKKLFLERLNYNYSKFTKNIPYPKLRIRKMTTRWGVCNINTHIITLNLELIKRDIAYLDYVIIHEMSHLIHGDHSRSFWKLVESNMPDYKKYREEMKEF
ncbi:MAG: M48 family metallopeptidase [Bacilli bacterium]|nr:M48 family metallopeptidase [Bacilli bacterium]